VQIQRVDHESRVHIDIETDDIAAEVARLTKALPRKINGECARCSNALWLVCYLTMTKTGSDAMPFATTCRMLGPGSCSVDTSTCVETSACDATAILL
jgi:hypothetical protein